MQNNVIVEYRLKDKKMDLNNRPDKVTQFIYKKQFGLRNTHKRKLKRREKRKLSYVVKKTKIIKNKSTLRKCKTQEKINQIGLQKHR